MLPVLEAVTASPDPPSSKRRHPVVVNKRPIQELNALEKPAFAIGGPQSRNLSAAKHPNESCLRVLSPLQTQFPSTRDVQELMFELRKLTGNYNQRKELLFGRTSECDQLHESISDLRDSLSILIIVRV